jgi:hypothetical protein
VLPIQPLIRLAGLEEDNRRVDIDGVLIEKVLIPAKSSARTAARRARHVFVDGEKGQEKARDAERTKPVVGFQKSANSCRSRII